MSLQIRCNCGWSSQVSEYYLGDRVSCPDCGAKLNVHEKAGVPYGYAPYPTWQKKIQRPMRPARHRSYPLFTPQNPHSGPAFWMGLFSLMLTFTGCGAVPGAILAIFSANSWARSRLYAKKHGQVNEPRAGVGFAMSLLTLGICTVMLLAILDDGTCHREHRPECRQQYTQPIDHDHAAPHEFRYEKRDREWYTQQAERYRAQQTDWERIREENGYRYPLKDPTPTPVEPKGDFQRRQVEYSERIRKQRQGAKPEYRYGD